MNSEAMKNFNHINTIKQTVTKLMFNIISKSLQSHNIAIMVGFYQRSLSSTLLLPMFIISPFLMVQTVHAHGDVNSVSIVKSKMVKLRKINPLNDFQNLGVRDIFLQSERILKTNHSFVMINNQGSVSRSNRPHPSGFMEASLTINRQQKVDTINKSVIDAKNAKSNKKAAAAINKVDTSVIISNESAINTLKQSNEQKKRFINSSNAVDYASINIKKHELATMQVLSKICPKFLDQSQYEKFNKAFNAQLHKLLPTVKNPKAAMNYLSKQQDYQEILASTTAWTLSYSNDENKKLCQDVVNYKY